MVLEVRNDEEKVLNYINEIINIFLISSTYNTLIPHLRLHIYHILISTRLYDIKKIFEKRTRLYI